MKRFFIGLITLGTMTTVHASKIEISQNKTYFETLGELFRSGNLPNINKISNIAWAGRCFLAKSPNEPRNAGYIFRKKRVGQVGPIGDTTISYEAASYWSLNNAPDYYDPMNLEEVLAVHQNEIIFKDANTNYNYVEIKLGKIPNNLSQLKVSGQYLVEEIFTRTLGDCCPMERRSVLARCYYFIPDLNN